MEAAWVVVWNTRNVRKGCYHINDGYSLIRGEDVIRLMIKQQPTLSFSSLEEEEKWCSFSTSSGFSATTSASLSMLSSIPATSTGCSSANTSGPQCRQSIPRISPGRGWMRRVGVHEAGLACYILISKWRVWLHSGFMVQFHPSPFPDPPCCHPLSMREAGISKRFCPSVCPLQSHNVPG